MSDQETQQPNEERSPKSNREERTDRGPRDRGRRRHQPQQQQQRRPEALLNVDELRELVELIAQHGFTDFELEREGIRVRLRRELAPQAVAAALAAAAPAEQAIQHAAPTIAASPAQAATAEQATQSSEAEKAAAAATERSAQEAAEEAGLHIITSPIVGTFYRSPSPTAEPFVRLGSHVDPDMVVCIIEAMKLMNEIQAETQGEVAKIYVENGQAVEYGQPLFGIKR
ncbi:MAG TPA: acetyl-CoA carboxylase biotin carboxyl carrier protein [Pyrinomonadaceae bacterium]|jgi:acetyl-CoA carboxylase biotin carboxyl carrier protein